jgi:hypothetical protein
MTCGERHWDHFCRQGDHHEPTSSQPSRLSLPVRWQQHRWRPDESHPPGTAASFLQEAAQGSSAEVAIQDHLERVTVIESNMAGKMTSDAGT